MPLDLLDRPSLPSHARAANDRAVLAAVLMPGVNLAVWQRAVMPAVPGRDVLAKVDDVALTMPVAPLGRELPAVLSRAAYPPDAAAAIGADIAMLGMAFAQVMDRDTLAIRLEVVETDACRRFHADYVTARLICTYAGPATQWLDAHDAAALRDGADPATLSIRQLATGDVAMFKGREWAPDGASGGPIVHRSPPIAATGERRLVLVIDPAPDAPIPHA